VGQQGLVYSNPVDAEYQTMSASNTIDLDAGETVGLEIVASSMHTQYNGFSGFYISS
jgi:hypothetical protein